MGRCQRGAHTRRRICNSQNPGLYGNVHVFGENGAAIGVQTDGGSMFIAGMTAVQEPPVNDLWTIAGEDKLLSHWQEEDRAGRRLHMSRLTHYVMRLLLAVMIRLSTLLANSKDEPEIKEP